MSKRLIGIGLIFSTIIFGISFAIGQPFSFQSTKNDTPTTRPTLTPEQFRSQVQTQGAQNRRDLSAAAKKNAKPLTDFPAVKNTLPTQQQPPPPQTIAPTTSTTTPDTFAPTIENYPQEQTIAPNSTVNTPPPVNRPPPAQNTQPYTGFPSNSGGGNSGTGNQGGGWNINY